MCVHGNSTLILFNENQYDLLNTAGMITVETWGILRNVFIELLHVRHTPLFYFELKTNNIQILYQNAMFSHKIKNFTSSQLVFFHSKSALQAEMSALYLSKSYANLKSKALSWFG